MKKITAIFAALVLCIGASKANNNPGPGENFSSFFSSNAKSVAADEVSRVVASAFKDEFANATNVEWKATSDFYFASFEVADKNFEAAFTDDGEFVAVGRQITFSQLPIAASTALLERYNSADLPTTVTEICLNGVTDYYLKADSKTHLSLVKCSPDGSITTMKKTKKKVLVGRVY